MLKTKRNSPGSESKFAPESKFGAKKKRHLPRFKVWSIVEAVTETPVDSVTDPKRKRLRREPIRNVSDPDPKRERRALRLGPIRNVSEAIKMSAKGLYKRAHRAETAEERQQYIEWARARTRWEFEVGIRKLRAEQELRLARVLLQEKPPPAA